LAKQGYLLHDTQWLTPHLVMFGGVEVSVDVYQVMLEQALHQAVTFGKIEETIN
jgi:leucyl/phenylalanyl-tRNA---protein transferase